MSDLAASTVRAILLRYDDSASCAVEELWERLAAAGHGRDDPDPGTYTQPDTVGSLLAEYGEWEAIRQDIVEREPDVRPDEWYGSDDAAVALLERMAAILALTQIKHA